MIFLTTGEKIKSLRKKFGMKQQELEDKNITRAFISMIETGKRGLSRETAAIIAKKFTEKAEMLGLELKIDEAYLLRTPTQDAEFYCLQKLNNNPTRDEIDVIINIAKGHDLVKVEAEAYKVLGDYEYNKDNYAQAFANYMISIDLYKNTDEKSFFAYLYNRLGTCKSKQLDYVEAATFYNRANYYSVLYKDETAERYSIYYLAKTLKKIENYDKALSYLDKYFMIQDKEKDFKGYVYASVLKANCYLEKGNINKSRLIFDNLMKDFKDGNNELLGYVYNNLGVANIKSGDIEKSLYYLDKAKEIEQVKDKESLGIVCISKAKAYIKQQKYNEALIEASESLKIASGYNNKESILETYYLLIDIYNNLDDFQGLKNIYIKFLEVIKDNERHSQEVVKIYTKLALLYLEQNDLEMCRKYLNMVS